MCPNCSIKNGIPCTESPDERHTDCEDIPSPGIQHRTPIISQELNDNDDYESPTRPVYPRMSEERKRISSFSGLKCSPNLSADLARCGFFYSFIHTGICCFYCNLRLDYREAGADILSQHARRSPGCEYIKSIRDRKPNPSNSTQLTSNHITNQIPEGCDQVDHCAGAVTTQGPLSACNLYASRESAYVCRENSFKTRKCETDSTSPPSGKFAGNSLPQLKDPGDLSVSDGVVTAKPRYRRYATIHSRLSTYHDKWPQEKKQRPEQLARAGLFYVGREDAVRCFFCNIGLKNWQEGDYPWLEHARWFPKCGYLRQSRGLHFINTVQRLHKNKEANLKNAEIRLLLRDELQKEETGEGGKRIVSPAVESVLTMGYTYSEVTNAISMITASRTVKDSKLTAEEIMTVLIEGKSIDSFPETDCVTNITTEDSPDLSSTSGKLNPELSCKICMENSSTILFVPCAHLVACAECAFAFDRCPICRKEITGTLRVSRESEKFLNI